jgi:hypothetical protein
VRGYREVAIVLEGEVEITLEDGWMLRAGPGDVIDTPKGSSGYWKDLNVSRGCGRWWSGPTGSTDRDGGHGARETPSAKNDTGTLTKTEPTRS